jgi:hypothetical protein
MVKFLHKQLAVYLKILAKINLFIYLKYLLLTALFFLSFQLVFGIPFKLGFEFQEHSAMCPWSIQNYSLQKKPLIEAMIGNKRLWHIELDMSDIEFVTAPFSNEEKQQLIDCIKSIKMVIDSLQDLDIKKNTFDDWLEIITKKINNSPYKGKIILNKTLKYHDAKIGLRKIYKSDQWKPIILSQVTVQHHLEHTIGLYCSLFMPNKDILSAFAASLPFSKHDFMNELNISSDELETLNDHLSEKHKCAIAKYCNKLNGLIFLNALTMLSMTPGEEKDDYDFIRETVKQYSQHQCDAKINLILMSRRPFSEMWNDIKQQYRNIKLYCDYFEREMSKNKGFIQTNILNLFHKANYGELYYSHGDTILLNLEYLIDSFVPAFVNLDSINVVEKMLALMKSKNTNTWNKYINFMKIKNIHVPNNLSVNNFKIFFKKNKQACKEFLIKNHQDNIGFLLRNGTITSTMLRNLIPEIESQIYSVTQIPSLQSGKLYTKKVLESIDYPRRKFDFDFSSGRFDIKLSDVSSDLLSPPFPLDFLADSMGFYRNIEKSEVEKFGEAIIEIRDLQNIGKYFLKRHKICLKNDRDFLTVPESLLSHSLIFFEFLQKFKLNEHDVFYILCIKQ